MLRSWLVPTTLVPSCHEYVEKPLPASSTTGDPAQLDVGPVIETTGAGLTVTLTGVDCPVHPDAFVTLTKYEPAALTVIDGPVCPFDQTYEV
jgi:hypothetical protein